MDLFTSLTSRTAAIGGLSKLHLIVPRASFSESDLLLAADDGKKGQRQTVSRDKIHLTKERSRKKLATGKQKE